MPKLAVVAIMLLAFSGSASAQEPFVGQTLISPANSTSTFLIDMDGTVIQTWQGAAHPAMTAYELPDGSILRPCLDPDGDFRVGGAGGHIQRIDADDTVVWDYYFSTPDHQQHHDIEPLPDGHILMIAWEKKTQAEAEAAGRQIINSDMWPTLIIEVEPVGATGGNIVWEWHLWDHLIQDADPEKPGFGVVADHPELLNINYGPVPGGPIGVPGSGDWIHANAIDYNPDLDQIVFSARTTDEIHVIDHSTTTEEAAGHSGGNSGRGGDFLYRWGNPEAYGRGGPDDKYFYAVHGANWIDAGLPGAGNILAFNNGDRLGAADDYSTAVEIVPPLDEQGDYEISPGEAFGPPSPVWTYGGPGDFYAGPTQGSAQRLPNGNTLISAVVGGHIFEVSESGEIVWEYNYPDGTIPRAQRYWEEVTAVDSRGNAASPGSIEFLGGSPNPFAPSTRMSFILPREGHVTLEVFDVAGRRAAVLAEGDFAPGLHSLIWNGRDDEGLSVGPGVYFVRMTSGDFSAIRKVVMTH